MNKPDTSIVVSVVVPMFNAWDYVESCLESLAAQTYRAFEVIVVDDGSQDGTPERVREVCKRGILKAVPVRVITQANAGLSAARNTGLRAATGEYVYFMDGDDRLHPQLLELAMAAVLARQADYVLFDLLMIREKGVRWTEDFSLARGAAEDLGAAAFEDFVSREELPGVWRFVFKRTRLGQDAFCPGLMFEDNLFTHLFLDGNCRGVRLRLPLYGYCIHSGSLCQSGITSGKIESVDRIVRTLKDTLSSDRRFRLLMRHQLGKLVRRVVNKALRGDEASSLAALRMARGLVRDGLLRFGEERRCWSVRLWWLFWKFRREIGNDADA